MHCFRELFIVIGKISVIALGLTTGENATFSLSVISTSGITPRTFHSRSFALRKIKSVALRIIPVIYRECPGVKCPGAKSLRSKMKSLYHSVDYDFLTDNTQVFFFKSWCGWFDCNVFFMQVKFLFCKFYTCDNAPW